MKSIIKTVCLSLFLALALVSCKDEASVQTYFVAHQDLPEYKQIDLSVKLVDMSNTNLSAEEQDALDSFEKVSFLGYRVQDRDTKAYTKELNKAKLIFENEKYSELMDFSMEGIKVKVSLIGTDEAVDEVLLLLSNSETGFGVARILGDEMKPEKIMKLLSNMQNETIDDNQLKGIIDFLK